MEEALQRRRLFVLQPNGDHLAVAGRLLVAHDDQITIVNQGIDHGVAFDFQRVHAALILADVLRQLNHVPAVGRDAIVQDGDGLAGGNDTHERHRNHALRHPVSTICEFETTGDLTIALDEAGGLKLVQIVVDDRR